MTDADHLKNLRLLNLSKAVTSGVGFRLPDWEQEHLTVCAECRGILHVFLRQFGIRPENFISASRPTGPRFKVGDRVTVVTPGIHRDKHGIVVETIQPKAGDFVYRYRVRFQDGSSGSFFGFELGMADNLNAVSGKACA